jgi:hypothetical protein
MGGSPGPDPELEIGGSPRRAVKQPYRGMQLEPADVFAKLEATAALSTCKWSSHFQHKLITCRRVDGLVYDFAVIESRSCGKQLSPSNVARAARAHSKGCKCKGPSKETTVSALPAVRVEEPPAAAAAPEPAAPPRAAIKAGQKTLYAFFVTPEQQEQFEREWALGLFTSECL